MQAIRRGRLRWIRQPQHILLFVLVLCGILGGIIANDYGLSWDEPLNIRYARVALDAYSGIPHYNQVNPAGPTGPGYFMLAEIGSELLSHLTPFWLRFETRHFVYFLTYLLGTYGLFDIARRICGETAALASALLYLLQPLFWGHAFINPKDTPFMSLMILSVASGMWMVDRFGANGSGRQGHEVLHGAPAISVPGWLNLDWARLSPIRKTLVIVSLVVYILIVLDLTILHAVVLPWALRVIDEGLSGMGPGWLVALANRAVPTTARVDLIDYLWKATRIYWRLRLPALGAVSIGELTILSSSFSSVGRELQRRSSWKLITLAGVLLGLVSSARIVGAFAGVLVTCYALLVWKGDHLIGLVSYWLLAAGAGLCLRPYFWSDPIRRLWTSLIGASSFSWQGVVLFRGERFHVWELPSQYSPALLLQQLTIPAIILGGVGALFLLVSKPTRSRTKWLGVLLLGWTAVPLVLIKLTGISSYDRYRQLMFILPPLFVFAGYGVDVILGRFPSRFTLPALVTISLLPSIIAIIALHPYEYIYLNSFTGGIRSNYRLSEMDYWCLSTREGVEFVNENAPPESVVVVYGQPGAAQPILRSDLNLISPVAAREQGADYAIICTRSNQDLRLFPDADTVFQVAREGAVLAVVRSLQ